MEFNTVNYKIKYLKNKQKIMSMKKIFLLMTVAFFAFACTDKNGTGNDENEFDGVVMADGFYFYDGFDNSSGRHRISIITCTQKIGAQEGEYTDLMLWVYSESEPEIKPGGSNDRIKLLPTGPVSPFFTDGRPLPPLVYYIGAHRVDEQGEQNVIGSGWITYNADRTIKEIGVCEKGEHNITFDETTKMYTITGEMIDETIGKVYKYKYSSDKDLVEMLQG